MRTLPLLVLLFASFACASHKSASLALPAGGDEAKARVLQEDPWAALDLADHRIRDLAGRAIGLRPDGLPTGEETIDGVLYRFARAGEAWDLAARGQRLAFAPKEGGRYYELFLACAWLGDEAADLELEVLGVPPNSRNVHLACSPRAAGSAYSIVSVPIATEWAIDCVRLPKDERLHVYAATVRWRREGPADAAFRRAFMANEMRDKDMRRYLKNLQQGGLFDDLTAEAAHERGIFDHLAGGRTEGARRLLGLRLASLETKTSTSKRDGVHVCLVVPPRADATTRLGALRTLVWVLGQDTELAGAVAGVDVLRALEHEAPDEFAQCAALVRAGRLEIAGLQEHLDWSTPPDDESLRAALASGAEFVHAHGWDALAHFGILGDLCAQPELASACVQAGQFRLVQWSEGSESDVAPPAFAWRSASGAGVTIVHVPPALDSLTDEVGKARLARAKETIGVGEVLLALAVDPSRERTQERLAHVRAISEYELAPRFVFSTPTGYFEALRKSEGLHLAPWQPRPGMDLGRFEPAPLALRSANRRAEAELETAARAGALAQLDGLTFLRESFAALEVAQRANLVRADDGAAGSARTIALRARSIAQEGLVVLARAAKTEGAGQALVVFNPLPFERRGIVALEASGTKSEASGAQVIDAEKKRVPSQRTADGRWIFQARVPGFGHAVFQLLAAESADATPLAPAARQKEWDFENGRFSLRLDPKTGELTSLRVQPEGLELLGQGSNTIGWLAQGANAGSASDANAGSAPDASPGSAPASELQDLSVIENGPVRMVVRIERRIGAGLVVEDLILERDRPELLVRCRAEGFSDAGTVLASFVLRSTPASVQFDASGGTSTLAAAERDPLAWVGMRRFVAAADGDWGLALLSADAARFASAGPRLSIELAQGGSAVASECSFALRPFVLAGAAGNMASAADDLVFPLLVVRAGAHLGVRPAKHSYLELSRMYPDGSSSRGGRAGVELTRFRPVDDGYELVLQERIGQGGQAELALDRTMFASERLDPITRAATALKNQRVKLELPLAPWKREILHLRLRP